MSGEKAKEHPAVVDVVCGALLGKLWVKEAEIEITSRNGFGRRVAPPEFEKLAGRGSAKKWKSSVRVLLPNGAAGKPVGDWLASFNIDIRGNNYYAGAEAIKRVLTRPSAAPTQALLFQSAAKKQVSMEAVEKHLASSWLGLQPSDPTVTELPAELPKLEDNTFVVDLNQLSMATLLAAAAKTRQRAEQHEPLSVQPGVFLSAHATVTGQQKLRRKLSNKDRADVFVALGEYVMGARETYPDTLHDIVPFFLCGRHVDPRALFNAVRNRGGFEDVTREKLWADVASELNVPAGEVLNAPQELKSLYQKALLRFERQARVLRNFSAAVAGGPTSSQTSCADAVASQPVSSNGGMADCGSKDVGDASMHSMSDGAVNLQNMEVDAMDMAGDVAADASSA